MKYPADFQMLVKKPPSGLVNADGLSCDSRPLPFGIVRTAGGDTVFFFFPFGSAGVGPHPAGKACKTACTRLVIVGVPCIVDQAGPLESVESRRSGPGEETGVPPTQPLRHGLL